MSLMDDLTAIEQQLTPTDGELIDQALAGDPESIIRVRRHREAVEHLIEARRLLREVENGR